MSQTVDISIKLIWICFLDAPKAIDVSTILGPTPRKTPQKQDNISFQTSLLQHQPQNNSGTQYLVSWIIEV